MAAEGTATAGTDVPASPVRITSASTYVRSQLDGALSLSSYATSVGFQTTAGGRWRSRISE